MRNASTACTFQKEPQYSRGPIKSSTASNGILRVAVYKYVINQLSVELKAPKSCIR